MKIVQTADYLIYFDNVRMDPFIATWNTTLGLTAGQASAAVTMYNSPALLNWKAYLTQVRVFVKNVFTGKYTMVFEGEIVDRNWDDSRRNSGKISYMIQGFFHWLQTPIPLMISNEVAFKQFQNFIYEAQGVNSQAVTQLFANQKDITLQDRDLVQIINLLFDKMNQAYYEVGKENSAFGWAKMKDRFSIMVDIIKEYRSSGFLDIFTLNTSTQIQSFYVYLNQILEQMMFEFYQDRDGALRIKNPSWKDDILKSHVIDESLIIGIGGSDGWSHEPTRVLAIGGIAELFQQAQQNGSADYFKAAATPLGLYVGDAQKGDYYSTTIDDLTRKYGISSEQLNSLTGAVSTEDWFDNLTGKFTVTSPFTGSQARTDVAGETNAHRGTDYGLTHGTLVRNIGSKGKVAQRFQDGKGGNILVVDETLDGKLYRFRYMHLSAYEVNVGDNVEPGQVIARSGSTGEVTGPHLHLEIWDQSTETPLDPDVFLRKTKDNLKTKQLTQNVKSAGSNAAASDPDYQNRMNAIQNYRSKITSAAASVGVDVDLAVGYMAVEFEADTTLLFEKIANFLNESYIGMKLTYLQGVSPRNREKLIDAIKPIKGDKFAEKAANTIYNLMTTSNGGNKVGADTTQFNAFSNTDNANNPFSSGVKLAANPAQVLKNKVPVGPAGNASVSPAAATDWMDFEATAYIALCPGCSGITRSGKDVRDTTIDHHVIAIDPTVIPLHSLVEIQGPRGVSGVYDALDTGGDIKGRRIDILMNSLKAATSFGREPIKVRVLRWGKGDSSDPNVSLRTVKYPASDFVYPLPSSKLQYKDILLNNTAKADPNLLASIIDVMSSWRPSFEDATKSHLGLMGLSSVYTNKIDTEAGPQNWLDGNRSVEFGSQFLAHAITTLRGKVTLGLVAFYFGDPQIVVDIAGEQVWGSALNQRSYDYVEMRDRIAQKDQNAVTFVDNVLQIYLTLFHADYIQGDPHKDFGRIRIGEGDYVNLAPSSNTIFDGFTNPFALKLSEEELRFKLNLKIVEQRLIRYDSKLVGNDSRKLIDNLIFKYAKYIMQLSRAASHVMNVSLATCMPLIRPGFNAWIEPSRKNLVVYVTAVSHQGAFSQGCSTTLQTEFTRTPTTYDDIDESIFIGEVRARAEDFGAVVKKENMTSLRQQLVDLNEREDEVVDDAHNITVLRDLYQSSTSTSKYVTEWNAEYTKEEIDQKINTLYATAPSVIIGRVSELKKVVEESGDFFTNKLLADFDNGGS